MLPVGKQIVQRSWVWVFCMWRRDRGEENCNKIAGGVQPEGAKGSKSSSESEKMRSKRHREEGLSVQRLRKRFSLFLIGGYGSNSWVKLRWTLYGIEVLYIFSQHLLSSHSALTQNIGFFFLPLPRQGMMLRSQIRKSKLTWEKICLRHPEVCPQNLAMHQSFWFFLSGAIPLWRHLLGV